VVLPQAVGGRHAAVDFLEQCWLRGPSGCNDTSASLISTWHWSLQQRHLQ
jgi:hypothetical protein